MCPPDPVPGVTSGIENLDCYSGLHSARTRVYHPTDIEQLCKVFAYARQDKRCVTFRAGGHSFDSQALGNDVVISMMGFDAIDVCAGELPGEKWLCVGPGATWGSIVKKLESRGLLPAVTVTTAHATAGGTLAGDCLSRFSVANGKEGRWVESFDLLKLDGSLLTCTPPGPDVPATNWTLEERAFFGVIGGLGYLGAVVAITYRLLSLDQHHGPIGVQTKIKKFNSFDTLSQELVPAAQRTATEASNPNDPTKHDAIYSALYESPTGERSALLFRSHITTETKRDRMLLHRTDPIARIARIFVEWMMRRTLLCRLCWSVNFALASEEKDYIDDLAGYTFFMEGNRRAKHLGRRLGLKMQTVQQTFIVPSDPGKEGGWNKAEDDLVEWLRVAHKLFRDCGLTPTLVDVLYLPQDKRFLLSATAGLAGFAVSYAFETSNAETIAKVEQAFRDLSDILWETFEGRVYLVKNVHARKCTLAAMYGQNAIDFFRLKKELDPEGRLRNEFLEHTFGDLLEAPSR